MNALGKSPGAIQSNYQSAQDVVKIWLEQKNKTGLWISGPAGYGKSQFCNFLATQDMSPLLRSGEIFFWISFTSCERKFGCFWTNSSRGQRNFEDFDRYDHHFNESICFTVVETICSCAYFNK